jgi:hypothetical protein
MSVFAKYFFEKAAYAAFFLATNCTDNTNELNTNEAAGAALAATN